MAAEINSKRLCAKPNETAKLWKATSEKQKTHRNKIGNEKSDIRMTRKIMFKL